MIRLAVGREGLLRAALEAAKAQKGMAVHPGVFLGPDDDARLDPILRVETQGSDFLYGIALPAVSAGEGEAPGFWVPGKALLEALRSGTQPRVRVDFGEKAVRVCEKAGGKTRVLGVLDAVPAPAGLPLEADMDDPAGLLAAVFRTREAAGRLFMEISRACEGRRGRVPVSPGVFAAVADEVQAASEIPAKAMSVSVPGLRHLAGLASASAGGGGLFAAVFGNGLLEGVAPGRRIAMRAPSASEDLVQEEGEAQAVGDEGLF